MPLRRPGSPLTLETCSDVSQNLTEDEIIYSDDELDEQNREARRQRIEKLAENYLQGTPLFILSAALRGPLEADWVNPWKKDRRKANDIVRDRARSSRKKRHLEQVAIPETNSHKRRQYQTSFNASCPSPSAIPLTSYTGRLQKDSVATESQASPRPASGTWLRKDNISTRFQNIDPPTSPTTSISSRHQKIKGPGSKPRSARVPKEATESAPEALTSHRPKQLNHSEHNPGGHIGEEGVSCASGRYSSSLNKLNDDSQTVDEGNSFHVVSSSSQLPKFEYRLKKHGASKPKASITRSEGNNNGLNEDRIVDTKGERLMANMSPSPSVCGNVPHHSQSTDQHPQDSMTLSNVSNTAGNPSESNPENVSASDQNRQNTGENLPSAQHAPGNPPIPDNVTSLYSIAVSKGNSNHAEDNNPDAQFSTQAALLMAQKSFQNDLNSPEYSPISGKKRRASQTSNHHTPNSVNITPFHQITKFNQLHVDEALDAPGAAGLQMVSTQLMIDAVTPFTFSTGKKSDPHTRPYGKERSEIRRKKTTSFATSSPEGVLLEHSQCVQEDGANSILLQQSPSRQRAFTESQQNALPMTLTGTTPPTAQDGQGGESFNLSQAIAEAGSWLQQSFEISKDINQCRNTKPPSHSANMIH